jgi:hypothetical protein
VRTSQEVKRPWLLPALYPSGSSLRTRLLTSPYPHFVPMDHNTHPGSMFPFASIPSAPYPASSYTPGFGWMYEHSASGTLPSLPGLVPEPVEHSIYACKADDTSFIERVKNYQYFPEIPDRGKRFALLYLIGIARGVDSDDQDAIIRDWLEGSAENEVWLWVDGDEEKLSYDGIRKLHSALHQHDALWIRYPMRVATAALKKRKVCPNRQETPQQTAIRRTVHAAHPSMRVGMIIWLAMTSVQMKRLDAHHGLLDREQVDLLSLIRDWYSYVELVGASTYSWEDDVETIYRNSFESREHSCYHSHVSESYLLWFAMVRRLDPDYRPSGFEVQPDSPCPACRQCYQTNYHEPPSPLPVWMLVLSSIGWGGQWLNGIRAIHEAAYTLGSRLFSKSQVSYVEKELSNAPTAGALDHRVARWAQSHLLMSLLRRDRPISSTFTSYSLDMPPIHEVVQIRDYARRDFDDLSRLSDLPVIDVKEWFAAVLLLVCRWRSWREDEENTIADHFFFTLAKIQSLGGQFLLIDDSPSQFDDKLDSLLEDAGKLFQDTGHSCWFELPRLHRNMYIVANRTLRGWWRPDPYLLRSEWTRARACWGLCGGRVKECKRCLLSRTLFYLEEDVSFNRQPLTQLEVRYLDFSFFVLTSASVSSLNTSVGISRIRKLSAYCHSGQSS